MLGSLLIASITFGHANGTAQEIPAVISSQSQVTQYTVKPEDI